MLMAFACAGGCQAQVLEVSPEGATAWRNGPAVFTAEGVSRIETRVAPGQDISRTGASASVQAELERAALGQGLPAALVAAVARRESGMRPDAVSPRGAVGVMQLTPGAAADVGVDRLDTYQNIHGGAAYLRRMIDAFGGDLALGLAAYNAGPGAVRRYGGIPPFNETRSYVAAVLRDFARAANTQAAQ
jgi:soluble lytic murein transglycosylase-like protein